MQNLPIKNTYWLHQKKVYRVKSVSRGTDEIVLEDLADGKRYEVRYALFFYAYKEVITVHNVAKLLNRQPFSIYRYEKRGQINKPFQYPMRGRKDVRFYTKQDILDIHELIKYIHQGRPNEQNKIINNTLPDEFTLRKELRQRFGE